VLGGFPAGKRWLAVPRPGGEFKMAFRDVGMAYAVRWGVGQMAVETARGSGQERAGSKREGAEIKQSNPYARGGEGKRLFQIPFSRGGITAGERTHEKTKGGWGITYAEVVFDR